jgi:hypothetical protein
MMVYLILFLTSFVAGKKKSVLVFRVQQSVLVGWC